jgi:hypothetical protein
MNDPLTDRFEALLEPGTPDSLDVHRRVRRRSRRVWAFAAVAAVFLAVPTVAIAIDPTILPWKSADNVSVVIYGATSGKDLANGGITNGGVSGRGRFRAAGAFVDTGRVVADRRWTDDAFMTNGPVITLRFVTRGNKGTITYRVTIITHRYYAGPTRRWTIVSGTGKYKGLHGNGRAFFALHHTVLLLSGTLRR